MAHLLLCACVSQVRLAPRGSDWSADGGQAVWHSNGVEVTAELSAEAAAEFPVRGSVRSEHPGASVSFESDDASRTGAIGEILVDGEFRPIESGAWYEIPEGAESVAFGLRPDAPWTDPPAAGSRVSYELVVRDDFGTESCPFRFRVDSNQSRLAPEATVVLVILLAPIVVALLFLMLLLEMKTEVH